MPLGIVLNVPSSRFFNIVALTSAHAIALYLLLNFTATLPTIFVVGHEAYNGHPESDTLALSLI